MTSLEHLARTIALARHGTDAMWANYLGAAEAVEKMMSGWQPIETAPKDGTEILGYETRTGKCDVIHWRTRGAVAGYFFPVQSDGEYGPDEDEFGYSLGDITHWMKLPEPPK